MWIKGHKNGVGFWYVLWGAKGASYDMEVYQTLNGLVNWMRREAYREMPVLRVGRMVVTEEGFVEKECWASREEFIEWARPLVPFPLP
ncbi:hypothetical protein ES703_114104 [subsurface metagenome]